MARAKLIGMGDDPMNAGYVMAFEKGEQRQRIVYGFRAVMIVVALTFAGLIAAAVIPH